MSIVKFLNLKIRRKEYHQLYKTLIVTFNSQRKIVVLKAIPFGSGTRQIKLPNNRTYLTPSCRYSCTSWALPLRISAWEPIAFLPRTTFTLSG